MLFFVQALLVVLAVAISRYIQNSWIGRGLQALRDDELAAECTGVPTLRLKVLACVISGALMCAAGAPAAMYLQYADPSSAFNLNYSVSVLAMSLIGGTAHWAGPIVGAIVLGSTQQLLTVTISSEVNVLVLGVMLVLFVVAAPEGPDRPAAQSSPQAQGGQAMTPPETSAPLLQISGLTKRFGGFTALDNVSVDIRPGERFGLIGPNGSGKTTLINCISGAFRTEARHRGVPRRGHHAAAGACPHPPRHCAQLPDPAAVQEHDGGRKPDGGARFRGRPPIRSSRPRTGARPRCRS